LSRLAVNLVEPTPRALRIVAWLFLLGGLNSVLTILVCALHNQLQLDFGVIGIFVYSGLLRFSSGWRTCALVLLALALVMLPIIAVLGFVAPEGHLDLFGQHVMSIPPPVVSILMIPWFALALWEWNVLTRPEITTLFRAHSRSYR
jgi:hypothetical protein